MINYKKGLTAILASSVLVSSLPILAVSANNNDMEIANTSSEEQSLKAFELFGVTQEEMIGYAEKIGIDTNSKDILISDEQIEKMLIHMGIDLPELEPDVFADSNNSRVSAYYSGQKINGVTRIVNNGSGNINLYLSGTFIKRYYQGGVLIQTGLTYALGALSGGVLLPAAGAVSIALAGMVASEVEYGKIVLIRNWRVTNLFDQLA